MAQQARQNPLATCPDLVFSQIIKLLSLPDILRLRKCGSVMRDAAEAAPGVATYVRLAALLERLATSEACWTVDWDILGGVIAGGLRAADLPVGATCLFWLTQDNVEMSENSEAISWEVISMPVPNAPSSSAAQTITFGIFSHSGHLMRSEDDMHDMQITAEIPGKLPSTVIYNFHKHAGDYADRQQCFAKLATLLEVPETAVVQILSSTFSIFEESFKAQEDGEDEEDEANEEPLGTLWPKGGAAAYAQAMREPVIMEIMSDLKTLDRIPRRRRHGL
ncbi:hypothetical protein HDU87_007381 [Geranomyces variabilis]|uniref:F-box domain-containing protein n=1 Tax=Geranomyces variabilis TaxID=109894 RepID=A0AAD5XTK2_9FUNG|nr:hypothetical protein HDU87_007381 [Geranomyces variabilis]